MSLEKDHHEALRWLKTAEEDLGAYYIPTRYPNGLPDLTPGEVYLKKDADLCIRHARSILNAVKSQINSL
jgi:HEPN domain-containing protein